MVTHLSQQAGVVFTWMILSVNFSCSSRWSLVSCSSWAWSSCIDTFCTGKTWESLSWSAGQRDRFSRKHVSVVWKKRKKRKELQDRHLHNSRLSIAKTKAQCANKQQCPKYVWEFPVWLLLKTKDGILKLRAGYSLQTSALSLHLSSWDSSPSKTFARWAPVYRITYLVTYFFMIIKAMKF